MSMQEIASALERMKSVLRRRPSAGLHDDAPATARWENGTRVVAIHANGARVLTDMPGELGGSGDQVTPGWLFRAGLASCAATTIAMSAAAKGIEIAELEVKASSRSDTRGILGMTDADGAMVFAGRARSRCTFASARRTPRPRCCARWCTTASDARRYPTRWKARCR